MKIKINLFAKKVTVISILTVLVFTAISGSTNKKESIESGRITYEIEYSNLNFKFLLLKAFMPDESEVLFNERYFKLQTKSSLFKTYMILDKETKFHYLVEEISDSVLILKENLDEKEKDREVIFFNEYKSIKGYKCQKAIIKEKGREDDKLIYFTKELKAHEPVLFKYGINGCIIQKISKLKNDGGTVTMTLVNFSQDYISNNQFSLPKNGTLYTDEVSFDKAADEIDE